MYCQFDTTNCTDAHISDSDPIWPSANPSFDTGSSAATANPHSAFPTPHSNSRRKLDIASQREVCALVAGGCDLKEAARYVRCSTRTIRREMQRNPQFDDQIQRARTYAQLSPLRAMQHAASTHWRAAAWLLERAFPERFGRPDSSTFGARQARQLLDEVMNILRDEVTDRSQRDRIDGRIRAAFEYGIHVYCDRKRSAHGMRRAISMFEKKDTSRDPLANLGFPLPDFNDIFNPGRFTPADPKPTKRRDKTSPVSPAEPKPPASAPVSSFDVPPTPENPTAPEKAVPASATEATIAPPQPLEESITSRLRKTFQPGPQDLRFRRNPQTLSGVVQTFVDSLAPSSSPPFSRDAERSAIPPKTSTLSRRQRRKLRKQGRAADSPTVTPKAPEKDNSQ